MLSKKTLGAILASIAAIPLLLATVLLIAVILDRSSEIIESRTYPRRYIALVEQAAEAWDVPASVIYAVMKTESNFDPNAISHANAKGLMQITDDTYEWIYFLRGETPPPDSLMIPSYNIDAGAYLLSWLYDRYENWDTVYAAYNAGYSRVNSWLSDPSITENGYLVHIPIEETRNYVRVVGTYREKYISIYET